MRMCKECCKLFGAEFLVVGHDAVGGQGNFSTFLKAFLIILCRKMATSLILSEHPNRYPCLRASERSVLLLNTRSD